MTKDQELLAWAASKINQAQHDKIYGAVIIYVEAGVITRSETKMTDKPVINKGSSNGS
jgi:hypothetical protein